MLYFYRFYTTITQNNNQEMIQKSTAIETFKISFNFIVQAEKPLLKVLTVECIHVHWHCNDEAITLVQFSFQELTQHINANQLVAINDRSLGQSTEKE